MARGFWRTKPSQDDGSSVTSSNDFKPILGRRKQESGYESSSTYQSTTDSTAGYIPESGMIFADPSEITPLEMLGDAPEIIHCPFCQTHSFTKLVESGSAAQLWISGALCCVSIPCLGVLTPLPCIFNWCENIDYKCRNCTKVVARRPHNGGPIQLFRPSTESTKEGR